MKPANPFALFPELEKARAAGAPLVLATVVDTRGSSYSKRGAQLLVSPDGSYSGLLSGGCLEGDLVQRAMGVLDNGEAVRAVYDSADRDDDIFGMGSGCGGRFELLLQRIDASTGWQPLAGQAQAWGARQALSWLLVCRSNDARWPTGSGCFDDGTTFGLGDATAITRLVELSRKSGVVADNNVTVAVAAGVEAVWVRQRAPVALWILGSGPDASPLHHLAEMLGWQTRVLSRHGRTGKTDTIHGMPAALGGPATLAQWLAAPNQAVPDAVAVLSHHYASDLAYLRLLAPQPLQYLGLLGPPARRHRLLQDLGPTPIAARSGLRSPIGLDVGADSAAAIALAIAAEIHQTLHRGRHD